MYKLVNPQARKLYKSIIRRAFISTGYGDNDPLAYPLESLRSIFPHLTIWQTMPSLTRDKHRLKEKSDGGVKSRVKC